MRLPPTVGAAQITCVHVRRHLHASMTLYSVKCSFVTGPVGNQTLLGPVADLHPSMLSNQLILLLRELCSNRRLYLGHNRVLHENPHSVSHRGDVSRNLRTSKRISILTHTLSQSHKRKSLLPLPYSCYWMTVGSYLPYQFSH